MRILQVSNLYYPELKFGGPPQKIHALTRGLIERGHDVSVVTFHSERREFTILERIDDVQVQYLSWVGWGLRQWPLSLSVLLDFVCGADIVHCYGLYDLLCPVAAFFALRFRRPYLLEPLGMFPPRAANLRAKEVYHRLVTSRMAQSAAGVVAASPAEMDDLRALAPHERLILRRNGIDAISFKHLPPAAVFRARYQISRGTTIVLYLGRISPIKNLEQLLAAFRRANLASAILLLAGPLSDVTYEGRLRCLIAAGDLEGRAQLLGPLYGNDKLAAFAAADIFVLPSLNESFGNAAAEAVAAGLPVLLTDKCGIAPLIHERAGLAVPVGVKSLADGLLQLVEDVGGRRVLTSRQAEVVHELSWTEPVRQTEELYQRIVRGMTPNFTR